MSAFAEDLDKMLSPEPWCIDDVSFDGNLFWIKGWALAPRGRHGELTFTINDKEFDHTTFPMPRADVAEIFWYKAGADRAAFECRTSLTAEQAFKDGYATLKCVSRNTGLPLREDYNWYFPDDRDAPALPDPVRRKRVAGEGTGAIFRLEGYTTFKKLEMALLAVGNKTFDDFRSILDWGCGCGRLTRYFYGLSKAKVTGVDIDLDNLNWSREHLPFAQFHHAPLDPPTEIRPSSFELLIGISVFSHLREPDQIKWLYELNRIAKPGALLAMSVLGEATAGRARWDKSLWDEWHKTGFFAVANNVDLKDHIEDEGYYVSAYMTEDYVRRTWSRFFDIVAFIPAYIGNQQDLIVMRKSG